MPKKRQKEPVRGAYFVWLLGQRNGVWQADGRSNEQNVGRHSLGTKDRDEALRLVHELDLTKAVELGRADRSVLKQETAALVPLDEGRKKYIAHVGRPPVMGGASSGTAARYKAVFDKFVPFAEENHVRYWQQVTDEVLVAYGKWLDDRDYAGRSLYLELTTIKQAVNWLIDAKVLPASSRLTCKLSKVQGTNTYCYSPEEVRAIIAHCRGHEGLNWLGGVVTALATTGLRIGELADLRWSNVALDRRVLELRDTSRLARKSERQAAQTTKSHRGRALPLHAELYEVLQRLPRAADQRVFHGPLGGRLKPDTVRNVLQREVLSALAARFPGADGRPGIAAGRVHSFRHYFASTAANNDIPEQVLMDWLGHRESRMLRHYYHLRQDEARRQMDKLPPIGSGPPSGVASGTDG